jgi:hypothetical protein
MGFDASHRPGMTDAHMHRALRLLAATTVLRGLCDHPLLPLICPTGQANF